MQESEEWDRASEAASQADSQAGYYDANLPHATAISRSRLFYQFSSSQTEPEPLIFAPAKQKASKKKKGKPGESKPKVVDLTQSNGSQQAVEPSVQQDEEAEVLLAESDARGPVQTSNGWTVINDGLDDELEDELDPALEKKPPGLRSLEDVIMRKADLKVLKEPQELEFSKKSGSGESAAAAERSTASELPADVPVSKAEGSEAVPSSHASSAPSTDRGMLPF